MDKGLFESLKKVMENEGLGTIEPEVIEEKPVEEVTPETPEEKPVEQQLPEITDALVDELYAGLENNVGIDKEQFKKGLSVELEHYASVDANMQVIASIAADHLKEIPNYYDFLDKMETEAKAEKTETPAEEKAETPAEEKTEIETPVEEGKIPANPAEYDEKQRKDLFEKNNNNANYLPKGIYEEVDVEGKKIGQVILEKAGEVQSVKEIKEGKILSLVAKSGEPQRHIMLRKK